MILVIPPYFFHSSVFELLRFVVLLAPSNLASSCTQQTWPETSADSRSNGFGHLPVKSGVRVLGRLQYVHPFYTSPYVSRIIQVLQFTPKCGDASEWHSIWFCCQALAGQVLFLLLLRHLLVFCFLDLRKPRKIRIGQLASWVGFLGAFTVLAVA